jgi:hypothetical protein
MKSNSLLIRGALRRSSNKLATVGTLAAVAGAATAKAADPIADAITQMGTLATSIGGGTTVVLGVVAVFVGLKIAKRLMGKL